MTTVEETTVEETIEPNATATYTVRCADGSEKRIEAMYFGVNAGAFFADVAHQQLHASQGRFR